MAGRKPPNVSFETWVERQIREAQERGSFDNLPGQGKPIAGLDRPRYDLAWVAELMRRENLPASAVLPTSLVLRKELEDLPALLDAQRTEADVTAIAEDLKSRIREAHRRPQVPPLTVMSRDVDHEVTAWRQRRRPAAVG